MLGGGCQAIYGGLFMVLPPPPSYTFYISSAPEKSSPQNVGEYFGVAKAGVPDGWSLFPCKRNMRYYIITSS